MTFVFIVRHPAIDLPEQNDEDEVLPELVNFYLDLESDLHSIENMTPDNDNLTLVPIGGPKQRDIT